MTRQSTTTAAMRYRFTCPSSMVRTTGSRAIPARDTMTTCLHGSRNRQPMAQTATRQLAIDPRVNTQRAPVELTKCNGVKTTAANGG